jgi:hypothetical protein
MYTWGRRYMSEAITVYLSHIYIGYCARTYLDDKRVQLSLANLRLIWCYSANLMSFNNLLDDSRSSWRDPEVCRREFVQRSVPPTKTILHRLLLTICNIMSRWEIQMLLLMSQGYELRPFLLRVTQKTNRTLAIY